MLNQELWKSVGHANHAKQDGCPSDTSNAVDCGVVRLLRGDRSSQGPNTREVRENKGSSVESKWIQPPVNETLGAGITSLASLLNDIRLMQSSSGIPLPQGGLSDQWNINRLHMGSM